MSPGASAQVGMHQAGSLQDGARHGSRASAVLGIQERSLTLYVIIKYSPMQKQFGCIKKNTQVSDEISKQMHHDFQFFNEINADSSFSNVDTTSSLTCITYYKCKMQAVQKGNIGITLVSNWFVPFSRSKSNNDAARRAIDFMLGW